MDHWVGLEQKLFCTCHCFLDLTAVAGCTALLIVGLQTPSSADDHIACCAAEYSKAVVH